MLEPEIEPHARDARAFIVCSARLEIIPPAVMAASQRRYLILEETIWIFPNTTLHYFGGNASPRDEELDTRETGTSGERTLYER